MGGLDAQYGSFRLFKEFWVMSQSWGLYYENTDSPSKIEGVAAGRGSMIRGEG